MSVKTRSGWGTLPLLLLLAAAAIVLPALGQSTQPAAAVARPDTRVKNCTSGNCHAAQRNYKVLHGPNAVGACDGCHVYADEKAHTFKLREQKQALCNFCHIGGGGETGTVVHKPFADGDCLSCHNPHGGSTRTLLRKDNLAALCTSCHENVTKDRNHLHGPVASGSCAACHSAHKSKYPKLVAMQGRELCLSCHDQMKTQLGTVKVVHKPVTGDCQQCHETHASNYKMQLKNEPAQLCIGCHEPIQKLITTAAVKHSATVTGDACLNCHTPHGSDLAKLMKAESAKACLSCHDKKIEVGKDRVVASLAAVADPSQNKHGPIRDGDCSGCHSPHGSQYPQLLSKTYPEAFYQPFDIEKYGLCFSCHDKQLVLLKDAKGLTKFRNGQENLHFAHVNKPDKGRNCRACHETHTSTLPMHLRETTPFGKWEMPIGFKQTPTGGSCKPGCHEEYGYDRDKPVQNNVPQCAAVAKP